jgi:2-dehydropantoate 2-reductase
MDPKETIYVLGCGAVGFPLAAYLANAGKTAVAVRTSRKDVAKCAITIGVHNGANRISVPVETISLSKLTRLDGMLVITAKSYANQAIAQELKDKGASGPIVIMQNGIGVEKPFLDTNFYPIYRCILYVTGQAASAYEFKFRPVTASPIGTINGSQSGLKKCIEELTTDEFPFRSEANIQREIWKKAIINSVFNSICPLLEVDNGTFARDEGAAHLAKEVVRECLMLTGRLGIGLSEGELMEQIMLISKRSNGQLISTLQDIQSGRQTEIEFLNLEMSRVAAALQPGLELPRTELLGKMILAKSKQQRKKESQEQTPAST